MKRIFEFFSSTLLLAACSSEPKTPPVAPVSAPAVATEEVAALEYEVISKIPHDKNSFTEGLFFHNGQLFESTGSPDELPDSRSVFGILDQKTGQIQVKATLDKKYFGEGIVLVNDKIYQLTYKDQLGFIYDAKNFKKLGEFKFKSQEGWGMTTDGTSIIMSDGTNILTYLDPSTLKETKTLTVTNGGYPEDDLNELEYIEGFIYANIWTKNYVAKIDPANGKTVGIIDFSALKYEAKSAYDNAEVLNGLAYDPASKTLYVTGKLFPFVYLVKLKENVSK